MSTRIPAVACAKFLVAGEFSVLEEGPALAIPLPYLTLSYEEERDTPVEKIFLNDEEILDVERRSKVHALRRIMAPYGQPSSINIQTNIPIAKGLGSSAALCVSMARWHHPAEKSWQKIASLAIEGEKLFHGTPSGVDPYCVSYQKPIEFTANPISHKDLDLSGLKKSNYVFVLRDSGGTHATSGMLPKVRSNKKLLSSLANDARAMKEALACDPTLVPLIMNQIQARFAEGDISSPAIDSNIQDLLDCGALGAKITGSGRGGFVLAVFEENDFAKLPLSVRKSVFSWRPEPHPCEVFE